MQGASQNTVRLLCNLASEHRLQFSSLQRSSSLSVKLTVTGIPGEQDGDIMVQGVGIPLGVDGFLPLAKTSQGVVGMVANFQILLREEN